MQTSTATRERLNATPQMQVDDNTFVSVKQHGPIAVSRSGKFIRTDRMEAVYPSMTVTNNRRWFITFRIGQKDGNFGLTQLVRAGVLRLMADAFLPIPAEYKNKLIKPYYIDNPVRLDQAVDVNNMTWVAQGTSVNSVSTRVKVDSDWMEFTTAMELWQWLKSQGHSVNYHSLVKYLTKHKTVRIGEHDIESYCGTSGSIGKIS